MTPKQHSITLLVLAEIAGMSLWFVSSAILGDMSKEVDLSTSFKAALASSVSAGFVIGALLSAITGLPDRIDPRFVFGLSAVLAALANAGLVMLPPDSDWALLLRFATGFFLAGVYPVGMKIAVGWGTNDRGLLVGLLVGGLTFGAAFPHLLALFGGADWRITTLMASAVAALGAVLISRSKLGPHHAQASRFQPDAIKLSWQNKSVRSAFAGYLAHVWELYGMWAWISIALTATFTLSMQQGVAEDAAKLVTFLAISAGALCCPIAGVLADKYGKAKITIIAMAISGVSAVVSAILFYGNPWVLSFVVLIWGASVIADSAQFSALIADYAPADKVGSLMTFQTALGFTLTWVIVQITPMLAEWLGWPIMFCILALGPAIGIAAMRPLSRSVLSK